MGVHDPHFGERELTMRDDVETGSVDLPRSVNIFCHQLLVQSIVYPQVDVAPPETFLLRGRDVGDSSLIYLPHFLLHALSLHQSDVVEPRVVVHGVGLHLLLVLELPLADDDVFDPRAIPKPLLEVSVGFEEVFCYFLWDEVQCILVDGPGSLVLPAPLLKLGKGNKQPLLHVVFPKILDCSLKDVSGVGRVAVLLLESSVADPILHFWVDLW